MTGTSERVFLAVARAFQRLAEAILARPRIRAFLHQRALRAWRTVDAPLILCYGNINRSAFAAALVQARGRHGARSAGFYPVEERPAPDATIACAETYSIDLVGHRSARVRRRDAAEAQAIFVFDWDNLARVGALEPRALARTHLVGSLDDDPQVLIADPEGRGPEVLARTLARIARAIDDAETLR